MAHGKSTVVKALSGVHTVRFKNELERNITIKLGYANAKIYKSDDAKCQRPVCYTSASSTKARLNILLKITKKNRRFKHEIAEKIINQK